MKNITNYNAEKYSKEKAYSYVEDGIYLFDIPPDKYIDDGRFRYVYGNMKSSKLEPKLYVTSLTFELEPELGDGPNSRQLAQYPLEDLLDYSKVYISDTYEELNTANSRQCYLEFASEDIKDVRKLRGIISKHVYNSKGILTIDNKPVDLYRT